MKPLRQIFFLLFFPLALLHVNTSAYAQTGKDLELADQFFADGQYEKAAVQYEKVYDNNSSDYVFSAYLNCLIALKDFTKAEKLAKKQIKKNPTRPSYGVDLGYVYSTSGQTPKAKDQYEKVIKNLDGSQQDFVTVATSFTNYHEIDYAIETYLRGKKSARGNASFHFELADLYFSKRDIASMLGEYFEAMDEMPSLIQQVQNSLQSKMGNEPEGKNFETLRTELLRRIQKYPNRTAYTELLLWYFIQQKDFESAFTQAKALDLRLNETGERLFNLADLSISNENYDAAVKCYQYVISKGEHYPFYLSARMNLLNALTKKVTGNIGYTKADLIHLEEDYTKTINELGKNFNTVQMILGFAHLEAFYLDKANEAQKLLEETVEMAGIRPNLLATVKLELGDVLLFQGDIWEASLLYSQVEKSFHEDELGMEARYRNAKLSFYQGEFEFALFRLDLLKTATSQLISNDAIALTLLISDNTAMDTTTDALLIYSRADLLTYQNKDSLALLALDSLLKEFPGHTLLDDALFKKFVIKKKEGKFDEAASLLQTIVTDYSSSVIADDALFNLARLNETVFNNPTKAMELYQSLLTKYPASSFVVDARKKFRALRGDRLN